MKSGRQEKKRVKRYTVVLSESDMRRLTYYASTVGVDRPTALHRLVSKSLRNETDSLVPETSIPENQLGLFDSMQIDIFNNTHKAR